MTWTDIALMAFAAMCGIGAGISIRDIVRRELRLRCLRRRIADAGKDSK